MMHLRWQSVQLSMLIVTCIGAGGCNVTERPGSGSLEQAALNHVLESYSGVQVQSTIYVNPSIGDRGLQAFVDHHYSERLGTHNDSGWASGDQRLPVETGHVIRLGNAEFVFLPVDSVNADEQSSRMTFGITLAMLRQAPDSVWFAVLEHRPKNDAWFAEPGPSGVAILVGGEWQFREVGQW